MLWSKPRRCRPLQRAPILRGVGRGEGRGARSGPAGHTPTTPALPPGMRLPLSHCLGRSLMGFGEKWLRVGERAGRGSRSRLPWGRDSLSGSQGDPPWPSLSRHQGPRLEIRSKGQAASLLAGPPLLGLGALPLPCPNHHSLVQGQGTGRGLASQVTGGWSPSHCLGLQAPRWTSVGIGLTSLTPSTSAPGPAPSGHLGKASLSTLTCIRRAGRVSTAQNTNV